MRYLRSYSFLWESPNAVLNILWVSVFLLVPVLGILVLLGYAFETIQALLCEGQGRYPDFDCRRLGRYLVRGLRPFAILLIGAVPLGLLAWLAGSITAAEWNLVRRGESTEAAMVLVASAALLLVLACLFLEMTALAVLTMWSGVSQEGSLAGALSFARDFVGRVGGELLLAQVFVLATAPLLLLIGVLLFGIGLFPALASLCMAQYQLLHQLYQLHLQRGGEEIPLKVEELAM